jgi:hypothetical protein
MNLLKCALIVTLTIALTALTALAGENVVGGTDVGENLLHQLWANMEKPDIEMLQKTTAKGFQSVHQYGANTREQEIELIKGLKLGKYTLSNVKITRDGPVIVATYLVSVEETIKGKRLVKKPAPRLSVFLETDSGWKWIAHANLRALK